MRMERGFAARNRARIAALIVLATISYWLATVAAVVAAALTLVVVALFKASYIPDSLQELKWGGIGIAAVVGLAAVVGSLIAVFRLPTQRRRLEGQVLRETNARIAGPNDHSQVHNLLEGLA